MHTSKVYEFIVLWSAFIIYVTYVVDHSHWEYHFAGLLLHCQDSIVNESEDQK